MSSAHKAPFSRAVYAVVRRIPRGRVATYGQIAALAGHPGAARAVGTALARLPQRLNAAVPWHRVVATIGISNRRPAESTLEQQELLRAEGVEVRATGKIDVDRFRWVGPIRQRMSM